MRDSRSPVCEVSHFSAESEQVHFLPVYFIVSYIQTKNEFSDRKKKIQENSLVNFLDGQKSLRPFEQCCKNHECGQITAIILGL